MFRLVCHISGHTKPEIVIFWKFFSYGLLKHFKINCLHDVMKTGKIGLKNAGTNFDSVSPKLQHLIINLEKFLQTNFR